MHISTFNYDFLQYLRLTINKCIFCRILRCRVLLTVRSVLGLTLREKDTRVPTRIVYVYDGKTRRSPW